MQPVSTAPQTARRFRVSALAAVGGIAAALILWPVLGNTAAYVALALMLVAGCLGWSSTAFAQIVRAPWVLMLLGAFLLMTAAFSLQPSGTSYANIGDFALYLTAPLVALATAATGRQMTAIRLSALSLVAALVAAIVGVVGTFLGQARVTAMSLSPIHFADFAIIFGFLALTATLLPGRRWRLLFWSGPALGIAATIASGSRGALLVALALAALYGIVWMQRIRVGLAKKILVPLALCALVLCLFVAAYFLGFTRPLEALLPVWSVLNGQMPVEASAAYRVEMFVGGTRAFWDAPVFGHGWHSQLQAALPYFSNVGKEGYAAEQWGYIHSDPLSFAVGAGGLGIAAYALALLAPLVALRTSKKPITSAGIYAASALVLGLFVSGLTDAIFMVELPKLYVVIFAALFATGLESERA